MEENKLITLSLPLDTINLIMASLGKAPFEIVSSLIEEIRRQVAPQLQLPPQNSQE